MRRVPITVVLSLFLIWTENAVAAESKRLLLYSCFVESENAALFDAFARDTGIEIRHVRLSAGEALARLSAEDADNARRFLDWLLEAKTQEMLSRQFFRIPVNREVATPDTVTPLERINTIDYDVVWSAKNKVRLVGRFEREVRGRAGAR